MILFRLVPTTSPIRVTSARAFKREGESFCEPSHHALTAPESLSIINLVGESWEIAPAAPQKKAVSAWIRPKYREETP